MYFDAEKLIEFCASKKLTVEQFMLCHLIHTGRIDLLYKYCEMVKLIPRESLKDLEKRGFIINLNKKEETYPDNYIITDKFTDELKFELGEVAYELWEEYPSHVFMVDKLQTAKTISPEDLEVVYKMKLLKGRAKHEDVMKALREQKENGTLGMGLKKWVETEQWKREDNTLNTGSYDI